MSLACLAHVNFLLHMYFDLITEQINDDDDDIAGQLVTAPCEISVQSPVICVNSHYRVRLKNVITRQCLKMFAPNFARLFSRVLSINALFLCKITSTLMDSTLLNKHAKFGAKIFRHY